MKKVIQPDIKRYLVKIWWPEWHKSFDTLDEAQKYEQENKWDNPSYITAIPSGSSTLCRCQACRGYDLQGNPK